MLKRAEWQRDGARDSIQRNLWRFTKRVVITAIADHAATKASTRGLFRDRHDRHGNESLNPSGGLDNPRKKNPKCINTSNACTRVGNSRHLVDSSEPKEYSVAKNLTAHRDLLSGQPCFAPPRAPRHTATACTCSRAHTRRALATRAPTFFML